MVFDGLLYIGFPAEQSPIARLVTGFHVHAAEPVAELFDGRTVLVYSVSTSASLVALAELFKSRPVLLGKAASLSSGPISLLGLPLGDAVSLSSNASTIEELFEGRPVLLGGSTLSNLVAAAVLFD